MTTLANASPQELAQRVDSVLEQHCQRVLRQAELDRRRQERFPSGHYPLGWPYLQPAQPSDDRAQWVEGCIVFHRSHAATLVLGTVTAQRYLRCRHLGCLIAPGTLCAATAPRLGTRQRTYYCLGCCTHRAPVRPGPQNRRPYSRPSITASVLVESILEPRAQRVIDRARALVAGGAG
ncbi:MAG TPA: hypothetical protein VGN26_12585 [Armatimonadota bacterium]|jgi:hypothetical protein